MKTIYHYSVESAVEFEMTDCVNLKINDADVVLKTDKKHFLSEIVLIIPGSINETTGEAHKLSKFISDVFLMNYSPSCDVRKCEVHENDDEGTKAEDKKQPTTHCKMVRSCFSTRKSVKTLQEMQTQLDQNLFLNYSDAISSFADGLRVKSEIERYINYFKVIECVFMKRRNGLSKELRKCAEFMSLVDSNKGNINKNANEIIDDLVRIRNECSYLKPKSSPSIGFTSNSLDKVKEIKPYLPLLEKICRELLKI